MKRFIAVATVAATATIGLTFGAAGTASADNCHGQLTSLFAQNGISAQDVADFVEANLPGLAALIDNSEVGNGNGKLSAGEVHKAVKATFCS